MKLEYLEKNSTIFDAFSKFNKLGVKTLVVSDKSKKLLGVLSDGDLRRVILKNNNLDATSGPKTLYITTR